MKQLNEQTISEIQSIRHRMHCIQLDRDGQYYSEYNGLVTEMRELWPEIASQLKKLDDVEEKTCDDEYCDGTCEECLDHSRDHLNYVKELNNNLIEKNMVEYEKKYMDTNYDSFAPTGQARMDRMARDGMIF